VEQKNAPQTAQKLDYSGVRKMLWEKRFLNIPRAVPHAKDRDCFEPVLG